jgi:hypothetical protein
VISGLDRVEQMAEEMTPHGVQMGEAAVATTVQERQNRLALKFHADHRKYLKLGRINYHCALAVRWLASAAGLLAGALGLTNKASAATVGAIAGAAGLLLAFGRDLKFQQKANWHYRRAEGALRFGNRLEFELALPPSVDDIANLSKSITT